MAATITYLRDIAAVDTTLIQAVFGTDELEIWSFHEVMPMKNEHLTVEAALSIGCTIGQKTLPRLELIRTVLMQGAGI